MTSFRPTRVPVRGAIVLVTGAGSGIGLLMAKEAAARGAKTVLLWDINVAAVQDLADELTQAGVHAKAWQVDVADSASVDQAAKDVLETFGRVDILIASAGIVTGKYFEELDDNDIERTFNVNVFSLYRCVRPFLPGMIARDKGSVVVVASAAGLVGVSRQTDYSASKFAAVGFTESLRSELRHRGSHVRTLLVAPYYISTGMFDGVQTKVPAVLPILKPEKVATTVINAIERGEQRKVLPWFAHSVLGIKALPVPIFDWITDLFGISSTMDTFTGRRLGEGGAR
ncbi:SDR family oxidoreductase [Schaalia suimastitidis]|uniref:SDR family oxidoreductase n=1 Tax=Schaalia suimastitidis TaxID=121163 RepID=UPI0003F86AE9|nr:SDR family oxidoreductase [Schaalia suimastitidis]